MGLQVFGSSGPVKGFTQGLYTRFSHYYLPGHSFLLCVCQKRLTLLACTLQSLIKMLAVPFVDQCSFDRPGCIFLSKNRILSEKRPSSSAFRALMILIESEHKHGSLSSLLFSIFILGLIAIDKFLLQHFSKTSKAILKA